jgi:DNA-binding protein YbaB
MFNKVKQGKQLLELRSQAKKLQAELAEITTSVEEGSVKVKVSADQKVVFIEKDGARQPDIEKAINKAFKKAQKKAATKMMESGGGLSGLLSGMS